MDRSLIMMLMVTTLLVALSVNRIEVSVVSAQAENETASHGIVGDVLDAAKLQNLVENMYAFRSRVTDRGGFDSAFLSWFTPIYSSFSKGLLNSPVWSVIRFIFLPAAIVLSTCLPLYPQTGIIGVVLTTGFLTGLVYMFPILFAIEILSKTGLVATHGKTMLKILLVLLAVSAFCLLFAHATSNAPVLFSSYVMFFVTMWFTWFLPILLYYRS
ncbi:MAG: hypothetical protein QXF52_04735 [Thermoproteota archaeon]